MKWLALIVSTMFIVSSAMAEVKLPAIFSDGAVLQRDRAVAVWGWAAAGKKISVSFGDQKMETTSNADGTWKVQLAAMPAAGVSRELKVAEVGSNEIVVKDVLVGEVWLASGQSNMEWTVNSTREEDKALAATPLPNLRMITVPKSVNHVRQDDVVAQWAQATPENVMKFSAVGYFFGRNLLENVHVPIGIIHSSWGGTQIEPWLAEEGFADVPELAEMAKNRASRLPGQSAYEQLFVAHVAATRQWCDDAQKAIEQKKTPPAQRTFLALVTFFPYSI